MTLRRLACLLALAAAACGPRAPEPAETPATPAAPAQPAAPPALSLAPTDFEAMAGWAQADMTAALAAFRRSCATLAARDPNAPLAARAPQWGIVAEWLPMCAVAPAEGADAAAARAFFEGNFIPLRATAPDSDAGMLTG